MHIICHEEVNLSVGFLSCATEDLKKETPSTVRMQCSINGNVYVGVYVFVCHCVCVCVCVFVYMFVKKAPCESLNP